MVEKIRKVIKVSENNHIFIRLFIQINKNTLDIIKDFFKTKSSVKTVGNCENKKLTDDLEIVKGSTENLKNFLINYRDKIDLKLREKFDSNVIYKLKSMLPEDKEKELKGMLSNKEYKLYQAFKLVANEDNVDNFIDYLDQLVDLNNPKIKILVGNRSENYDHLSKYIETVFSDKIYRGIKIIYKNKVYDFSLSERNV